MKKEPNDHRRIVRKLSFDEKDDEDIDINPKILSMPSLEQQVHHFRLFVYSIIINVFE